MKVLLYAPQATNAMRHIVESFACELARHIEVVLYRPNTAGGLERGVGNPRLTLVQFEASKSRMLRGLAHYNPIRQYHEVARVRSLRPDLIHVFNGDGYLLPALALRMIPAVPMMVTLHDPIPHPGDLIGSATTALARMMVVPRAAAIHVFAGVFRDHLCRHGASRERVHVTRLGDIAEVFTRHDTSSVARENAAILFGRLEHYKGIGVLVEAGLALKARGKSRRVIIAGAGHLPRAMLRKILAHPDIFELHNRFISEPEAAILLKRASTCVLPYLAATQSALPRIAQAYGQRIVASRSGAFIEEIPLLGGTLVTPGSVEELADALEDDRESGSLQTPALDLYGWPGIADAMLTAYTSTIASFHNAAAKAGRASKPNEIRAA